MAGYLHQEGNYWRSHSVWLVVCMECTCIGSTNIARNERMLENIDENKLLKCIKQKLSERKIK